MRLLGLARFPGEESSERLVGERRTRLDHRRGTRQMEPSTAWHAVRPPGRVTTIATRTSQPGQLTVLAPSRASAVKEFAVSESQWPTSAGYPMWRHTQSPSRGAWSLQ